MPAKKPKETPKQQAERFAAEVERMIAAGELNPIEADAALEKVLTTQKQNRRPSGGGD